MHSEITRGASLIEVLVSITLLAVIITSLAPLFPGAMVADAQARSRTRAITAAESWLDHYRQGHGQTTPGGACTLEGAGVTCAYPHPLDHHADRTAALLASMNGMRATVRAAPLRRGPNGEQWRVAVRVSFRAQGGERHVDLATNVNR